MHTTSACAASAACPAQDLPPPRVRTSASRSTRRHAPLRHPSRSPAPCARVRAVGRHEAEHLRRFLDARGRGDAAAMRRWWEELVIDLYDRVDGLVARGAPRAARRPRARGRRRAEPGADLRAAHPHLRGRVDGRARQRHGDARPRHLHRRPAGVDPPSPPRGRRRSTPAGRPTEDRPAPAWEAGEATRRFEAAARSVPTRRTSSTGPCPSSRSDRRAVVELTLHGAELARDHAASSASAGTTPTSCARAG